VTREHAFSAAAGVHAQRADELWGRCMLEKSTKGAHAGPSLHDRLASFVYAWIRSTDRLPSYRSSLDCCALQVRCSLRCALHFSIAKYISTAI
jgi:hypothetical protein